MTRSGCTRVRAWCLRRSLLVMVCQKERKAAPNLVVRRTGQQERLKEAAPRGAEGCDSLAR